MHRNGLGYLALAQGCQGIPQAVGISGGAYTDSLLQKNRTLSLFTSSRERKLWYWAGVAWAVIFASIWLAGTIAEFLRDRGLISNAIWLVLFLVALAVLINGIRSRTSGFEFIIWIGLFAVYLMVMLRMTLPEERSHLIEYSVLALFIFEALRERAANKPGLKYPALWAIGITTALGILDECIQLFVPIRIFDPIDIFFNFLAAILAIGGSVVLQWVRGLAAKKIKRK